METKILNILFIVLIIIIFILLMTRILIGAFEKEESDVGGLKDITGAMESFEVSHDETDFYYPTKKNTERYDDRLFEYLEHIQEQRDKTFMKG